MGACVCVRAYRVSVSLPLYLSLSVGGWVCAIRVANSCANVQALLLQVGDTVARLRGRCGEACVGTSE